MAVVEQYARVQVLTDADLPDDGGPSIPVVLRYDPGADPGAVCVGLPGPRYVTFARELLEQGLRAPAGTGEVRVWPCGRVRAVVEFHPGRGGCSVVQFDTGTLLRFLRLTYAADRTDQPAAAGATTTGPAVTPPWPPARTTPATARTPR